jgi:hypothetical protein
MNQRGLWLRAPIPAAAMRRSRASASSRLFEDHLAVETMSLL